MEGGGRQEGREVGRREGGRDGSERRGKEKGGREEVNNCGVVLVVNIYYKLWKERHRAHNNGQRLVDAQLVYKWSTSVQ